MPWRWVGASVSDSQRAASHCLGSAGVLHTAGLCRAAVCLGKAFHAAGWAALGDVGVSQDSCAGCHLPSPAQTVCSYSLFAAPPCRPLGAQNLWVS